MQCFCHKLCTRQYQEIAKDEAEILQRTWIEAHYLFQPNPSVPLDNSNLNQARRKRSVSGPSPRPRKQARTLSHLLPQQPRDQLLPTTPQPQLPSAVVGLIKTYPSQIVEISEKSGDGLNVPNIKYSSVSVRLFLAAEQSNEKIEIQQFFRQICYYAFAKLHTKNTSVDPIVKEIEDALPFTRNTRQKVYNFLRIGAKWAAIAGEFASITNCPTQTTGILCLLGSASNWERASTEEQRQALKYLADNTDIRQKTIQFTPLVNKGLNQILLEHSFIQESARPISASKPLSIMSVSSPNRGGLKPGATTVSRGLHTSSEAPSVLKASNSNVSGAISEFSGVFSEDAKTLLTLLSFLSTPDQVPSDLLLRGAKPRGRWTRQGEIEEIDASDAGLDPELGLLLSSSSRVRNAFADLKSSSAISAFGQDFILDDAVASRVRDNLSPDHLSFWRYQALIVTYRSIPWKYVESVIPNINIFLPHLKHVLQAFQNSFESIPSSIKIDLALTLVEATRFPTVTWKRFAILQAQVAARGLNEPYLHTRIAESQCLLARVTGNMDQAISSLESVSLHRTSSHVDKRMHSAIGQITIQHSLNCIQAEDISNAKNLLGDWDSLGRSSPVEEVVLFRKHMIIGRGLRFQGDFTNSLAHLQQSRKIMERCRILTFNEDLRDLSCDLADTLRELDESASAEHYLRAEIARRKAEDILPSAQFLLKLSLAESLFGQERFREAEELCLDVESCPTLLKFEKLRLNIIIAKIRHVESDLEGALSYWNKALTVLRKFPMTNGRTTRIIVLSICDILIRQGQDWLVRDSMKQVRSLDAMAKPGAVLFWIAGTRHWVGYLESRGLRSRM